MKRLRKTYQSSKLSSFVGSRILMNPTSLGVGASVQDSAEPLKIAEISQKSKLDKKEVSEAIKELKKEGSICTPKRCCYSIPE